MAETAHAEASDHFEKSVAGNKPIQTAVGADGRKKKSMVSSFRGARQGSLACPGDLPGGRSGPERLSRGVPKAGSRIGSLWVPHVSSDGRATDKQKKQKKSPEGEDGKCGKDVGREKTINNWTPKGVKAPTALGNNKGLNAIAT